MIACLGDTCLPKTSTTNVLHCFPIKVQLLLADCVAFDKLKRLNDGIEIKSLERSILEIEFLPTNAQARKH